MRKQKFIFMLSKIAGGWVLQDSFLRGGTRWNSKETWQAGHAPR